MTTHTGTQRRPGATQGNNYAMRHGLFAREDVIEGEDHNEYIQLTARVLNEERVEGAVEGQLATRMAGLMWRLGRIARLEAKVWSFEMSTDETIHRLERLALYESRLSRELERARKELKAVQADRVNRQVEPVRYGPPPDRTAPVEQPKGKRNGARAGKVEKTISPRQSLEIWDTPFGAPSGGAPIECQRG